MADCYISNAEQEKCAFCGSFVRVEDGRYVCKSCLHGGLIYQPD